MSYFLLWSTPNPYEVLSIRKLATLLGTFLFVGVWVHIVLDLLFASLCFCVIVGSMLSHWYSFELILSLPHLFTIFLLMYMGHRGNSHVYTWDVVLIVVYTQVFCEQSHIYLLMSEILIFERC